MSIRAITWAFDQKTGSPLTKFVLIKLADNANEHSGLCLPSLETIAEQTEMSKSTVIRHIRKLEELRLLEVQRQKVGDTNLPNQYRLKFFRDGGSVTETLGVSQRHQGSVTETLGVVSQRHPNRKLEPEVNLNHSNSLPLNTSLKTSLHSPKLNNSTEKKWPAPELLIQKYNTVVCDDLPAVEKVTPARLKKAREYLSIFPEEQFWDEVFKEINKSLFLRGKSNGEGHRHFKANFDWLLTRGKDGTENAAKVYEGRYRK